MFSTTDADEEAHLSSCIHGYHIYNAIWSATVKEEFQRAKKLRMRGTDMQIFILQSPNVVGALTSIDFYN